MQKRTLYLLIFLLFLVILLGFLSFKKTETVLPPRPPETVKVPGPKLAFFPEKSDLKLNENYEIKILVDTKGKYITGADCVIKYDPNILEIVNDPKPGKIFPVYPILKVKKEKGEIDITGTVTDPDQSPFSGTGEVASFIIKPLAQGQANLIFEFTPGKINESNLPERTTSADILEEVTNASFVIRQ